MIVSENITLQLDLPVTNEKVEKALLRIGRKPLRWAIIEANNNNIIVSVSYEK